MYYRLVFDMPNEHDDKVSPHFFPFSNRTLSSFFASARFFKHLLLPRTSDFFVKLCIFCLKAIFWPLRMPIDSIFTLH